MITSTTICLNMGNIRSRIVHYYLLEQVREYETGDTINNMSLSFNKKLFKSEVPADRVDFIIVKFVDKVRRENAGGGNITFISHRGGDEYSPQLTQSNTLQRQKTSLLLDGIK